jgi:acyl-CoA dehydrogenase
VLAKFGTAEQKARWLEPLLKGEIRSAFLMTEPGVASSDASNIQTEIRREGSEYVINGRKWWSTGALDPRCKVAILMGKTTGEGSRKAHEMHTMVIVPFDAPGVTVVRPMLVFGYDDAPSGEKQESRPPKPKKIYPLRLA